MLIIYKSSAGYKKMKKLFYTANIDYSVFKLTFVKLGKSSLE